jgi:uncharacterized protein YigE (DUF2233 family)
MTMLRAQSVVAFCLLLGIASGAWGVECSAVKSGDAHYTVCRVDLRRDRLQLFLYDDAGKAFNSFERISQSLATRDQQLAFAMNAGMYREDFTPMGLMVTDGRQIHRLNQATGYGNFYMKPNGVFILSTSGARIVETTAYPGLAEPAQLATQSGPLLLQAGQVNSALNPQGTSRLIRNGVGIVSPGEVAFAISDDPVTFYEFALLFRDTLRCQEALYLDGNVSSLYSPSLGRADNRVPLGPIFGVTVAAPPR